MYILSGDIGGTKTLLQLAQFKNEGLEVLSEQRYPSNGYSELEQIISEFLHVSSISSIEAACFGVAGPVNNHGDYRTAKITNLPWQIDTRRLSKKFSIRTVSLINDFQAVGYGIDVLTDKDIVQLQAGSPLRQNGNRLIVGAGTGLGVAQLVWCENKYSVLATEGGHADFAPANLRQLHLAEFLFNEFGYTSVEFALSGPGLVNIYRFLAHEHKSSDSDFYFKVIHSDDPAAAVAQAASSKQDPIAAEAVTLFIEIYGGQAGNYALTTMATGGVYIAGGIAPKMIDELQSGVFVRAFNNKGKMSELMAKMPVNVVNNPNVGLLGSQAVARRLAENKSI